MFAKNLPLDCGFGKARLVFRLARQLHSVRDESLASPEGISLDVDPKHDGVYVLTMNKPESRNALSLSFATAIRATLEKAHSNREIRALILRSGLPNVFCAGADLKERLKMEENEIEPFVDKLRNLTNVINHLPFPTIAAIDGVAVGGGLEIALACDIRMASIRAKMGLVETKLAIFPGAGGTQRLPRLIGISRAKDLIFTGRIVDGEEAHQIGLVDYLDREQSGGAFKKSLAYARELSNQPPLAVKLAKFVINKGMEMDIQSGLAMEKACYARVTATKDRVEGLKAFVEKRPPKYKGE